MTSSILNRVTRLSQVLGVPLLRKEDPALLTGRGRYGDDLAVPRGTLHAHVVRSAHAHAKILRIDAAAALAFPGVAAVITGEDVRRITDPFLIALKAPVHQWALAVERVRYVGEPVALVVGESRYLAEDAAGLVRIDYEPMAAVLDPIAACGNIGAASPSANARATKFRCAGSPMAIPRKPLPRPTAAIASDGRISQTLLHPDRVLRRRRRISADRQKL